MGQRQQQHNKGVLLLQQRVLRVLQEIRYRWYRRRCPRRPATPPNRGLARQQTIPSAAVLGRARGPIQQSPPKRPHQQPLFSPTWPTRSGVSLTVRPSPLKNSDSAPVVYAGTKSKSVDEKGLHDSCERPSKIPLRILHDSCESLHASPPISPPHLSSSSHLPRHLPPPSHPSSPPSPPPSLGESCMIHGAAAYDNAFTLLHAPVVRCSR